jgi:hypothetical protein
LHAGRPRLADPLRRPLQPSARPAPPCPARRDSWAAATAAPQLAQQLQRLAASLADPATAAQAWNPSKLQAELTALVEAVALVSRQAHTSAPALRRLCLATLWQLQAAGGRAGSWGEAHEALLQEALLLWLLLHRQVRMCARGRCPQPPPAAPAALLPAPTTPAVAAQRPSAARAQRAAHLSHLCPLPRI